MAAINSIKSTLRGEQKLPNYNDSSPKNFVMDN